MSHVLVFKKFGGENGQQIFFMTINVAEFDC